MDRSRGKRTRNEQQQSGAEVAPLQSSSRRKEHIPGHVDVICNDKLEVSCGWVRSDSGRGCFLFLPSFVTSLAGSCTHLQCLSWMPSPGSSGIHYSSKTLFKIWSLDLSPPSLALMLAVFFSLLHLFLVCSLLSHFFILLMKLLSLFPFLLYVVLGLLILQYRRGV